MPIYEYRCTECHRDFEALVGVGAGRDAHPKCPKCGSGKAEKLFSTFASQSRDSGGNVTSTGGSSCGGCSATSCGSCSK